MTYKRLLSLLALGLLTIAAAPQNTDKQLEALDWAAGPVKLTSSNATLTLPPHVFAVHGAGAQKFNKLINGDADPTLEAVAQSNEAAVYFEYTDSGYVTADDWTSVDPKSMLDGITKNTDDANADRKTAGLPALHTLGWIQEPTFDKKTNTVRWAVSLKSDDNPKPFVNSIALVLGRHGYEEITVAESTTAYKSGTAFLNGIVGGMHFSQGARYRDFISGDKLAGFGIAALVGTAAGATIAKTIGFAGLLLLLKKFGILLVAVVVGAYRWIKSKVSGAVRGT